MHVSNEWKNLFSKSICMKNSESSWGINENLDKIILEKFAHSYLICFINVLLPHSPVPEHKFVINQHFPNSISEKLGTNWPSSSNLMVRSSRSFASWSFFSIERFVLYCLDISSLWQTPIFSFCRNSGIYAYEIVCCINVLRISLNLCEILNRLFL